MAISQAKKEYMKKYMRERYRKAHPNRRKKGHLPRSIYCPLEIVDDPDKGGFPSGTVFKNIVEIDEMLKHWAFTLGTIVKARNGQYYRVGIGKKGQVFEEVA